MESCDSLLAALDAFKGTIIMVTHNEMFLNALAEKSKALKPVETAINKTEKEIELNEIRLTTLNQELIKASNANDGPKIGETGREVHKCQAAIDNGFDELETLFKKKSKQN